MMENQNTNTIEEKISEMDEEIRSLKEKVKNGSCKNARLKSDINGKSNIATRISRNLKNEITDIIDKRDEKKFGKIEGPKITELITKHKHWQDIKEDIVKFQNEK